MPRGGGTRARGYKRGARVVSFGEKGTAEPRGKKKKKREKELFRSRIAIRGWQTISANSETIS